jgi:glycosyltransferase involved in cell wall biosynthesis
MSGALHVVQISFYLDPLGREPERLLHDWPSLVDVAEAVHGAGARVSVIQAACTTLRIERNGVEYFFVSPESDDRSIVENVRFAILLQRLKADIFHVHGFGFPIDVMTLASLMPRTPILVQDHADHVPRLWRRWLWRRALSQVAAVAFCARAQARPFVSSRLLSPATPVYEIPESSSRFALGDHAVARERAGLRGSPCVLWVGHLNHNKDPLTVLDAISRIVPRLPKLQLWCCFADAPLLAAVTSRIEGDAWLRERVHLLGRIEHDRIQTLMQAADIFVLGSHHEGSGYSLIEALACGVAPVVTDIPSFRALTGEGRVGRLWRCGDASSLSDALLAIASDPPSRGDVRAHFDAEVSFAAVGRKLVAAYQDLRAKHAFHRHVTRPAKRPSHA